MVAYDKCFTSEMLAQRNEQIKAEIDEWLVQTLFCQIMMVLVGIGLVALIVMIFDDSSNLVYTHGGSILAFGFILLSSGILISSVWLTIDQKIAKLESSITELTAYCHIL